MGRKAEMPMRELAPTARSFGYSLVLAKEAGSGLMAFLHKNLPLPSVFLFAVLIILKFLFMLAALVLCGRVQAFP